MKKEKKQQEETTYQIIEIENAPFNVLKLRTEDEEEIYKIICGNSIASETIFKSLEAAIEHIKSIDWLMIGTLTIKMIENHTIKNEIEKNINKAEN